MPQKADFFSIVAFAYKKGNTTEVAVLLEFKNAAKEQL